MVPRASRGKRLAKRRLSPYSSTRSGAILRIHCTSAHQARTGQHPHVFHPDSARPGSGARLIGLRAELGSLHRAAGAAHARARLGRDERRPPAHPGRPPLQHRRGVPNAYALTFGGLLLLGGRLGDVFGRLRAFWWGLATFTVFSLVGGLAVDPAMLVIA